MKVFLTLVITILLCLPVNAQRKSDRQEAGLLGAVKTVEAYSFSAWSTSGFQSKQGWISTAYNRKGDFTEQIAYDKQGNITSKLSYTFDEKGRNNGIETYYVFSNTPEPIRGKTIYILDKKGNIIEHKI